MQGILLSFNFEGERLERLNRIAGMLKLQVKVCAPAEQPQTVAALLGAAPQAPASMLYFPFDDEMLLFSAVPGKLLDIFLKEWKKGGCAPVSLKAVVTPTNFTWTARALHDTLAQEHRQMNGKS